MTDVDAVISRCGGVCALAKAIGIHHSSVILWKKTNQIPIKRVLDVERLSGIPREELRPDIFAIHKGELA
ncbi:Cro/CI family transcriptional regulator [Acetobacter pasteurianus]|uniref:CI repressor n=1 Tax=Acetobacter pasteurianus subsp. pasteurianus TaxID=481145 RepID=A0A1Y0Y3N1_ACEPA|nr:Cro/CI family transcriptional regulator [Acetobacter pasteurianus]ARW47067.1 hypothetical protein S1001342_00710 [Acetobacter pasteurianus subsp. pasteurianus]